MQNFKILVGKYVEKYYIDRPYDVKFDKDMDLKLDYSIFPYCAILHEDPVYNASDNDEANITVNASKPRDLSLLRPEQNARMPVLRQSNSSINRDIENLLNQMEETFSQRLLRLIDEKGMTDSEAYIKAHIDRRHFSKIRNDVNYVPNKKTVLAFAIALKLSFDEAEELLNSAGFAFSRSSKTDIIIAFFLQNNIYNRFVINEVLYDYGQPAFFD